MSTISSMANNTYMMYKFAAKAGLSPTGGTTSSSTLSGLSSSYAKAKSGTAALPYDESSAASDMRTLSSIREGYAGLVSSYTETKTTAVPIPYAWLLQNDSEIVDEFDAYEAAANATAANGFNKVWECYVTGISPTNEAAKFSAKIEMKDGAPVVTWKPDLNTNGIVRIYKVYGSETLENGGDWQYPTNSLHKFFKVTVEMP